MSDLRDRFVRTVTGQFSLERTARCEAQLIAFVQEAWHVLEPGTPFVDGRHLHAICEHLEAVTRGQVRNLLINIPPRHMKSLAVCVFWPVWEWITRPQRRWLFASYAASLSIRDSVKCRRLIESPWFQRRFGDRFQLCGDQNAKDRFDNDRAGCRLATSIGGAATGEGGDRVVVDDPHNVVERESDAAREQALTWWDQTMSTRLNDPKTGAKVIVMQRIHEHDLSGHVLKQGGYVHLCLPAEFESARRCITSIGWRDWRKREGELLWPARVGPMEIADLKVRLGPEGYAGQFQQRPAPAGGGRFREEWFRYFRPFCGTGASPVNEAEDPQNLDQSEEQCKEHGRGASATKDAHDASGSWELLKPDGSAIVVEQNACRRFAVMDPAATEAGEGRRPCYSVIQVWDVTPTQDMLLVHQYRQQVQAPDAAAAAQRIARRFDCEFIAIEKDGIGLGIVQSVKRAGITVRPLKARGSKSARSQTAEIRMANGQIYFRQCAPYLFDLESELLQFPRSQYCDQVDALSHAAMVVQRLGEPVEDDAASAGQSETQDAFDDES